MREKVAKETKDPFLMSLMILKLPKQSTMYNFISNFSNTGVNISTQKWKLFPDNFLKTGNFSQIFRAYMRDYPHKLHYLKFQIFFLKPFPLFSSHLYFKNHPILPFLTPSSCFDSGTKQTNN